MINKLQITGFKCFDHVELELRNFTLLAGRNSVGKTSVIQSVFTKWETAVSWGIYEYWKNGGAAKYHYREQGNYN